MSLKVRVLFNLAAFQFRLCQVQHPSIEVFTRMALAKAPAAPKFLLDPRPIPFAMKLKIRGFFRFLRVSLLVGSAIATSKGNAIRGALCPLLLMSNFSVC